jgi:hypothetical protein
MGLIAWTGGVHAQVTPGLGLDQANRVVAASLAEARKLNLSMAIAVVDAQDQLVASSCSQLEPLTGPPAPRPIGTLSATTGSRFALASMVFVASHAANSKSGLTLNRHLTIRSTT